MPKIIVADDSRAQLAIYKCMIEEMGHTVFCCKNGREALDKFFETGADLMIFDVNMPELDGIEACRELRKNPMGISVPVVIVSSNDQESDITAGLSSGANDYLSKPVKNAELRAKISALLEGAFIASFDDDALEKYQTVVAGRYTVVSRIGSGAHSNVYLAHDEKDSGSKVAIKIFNKDVSGNRPLLDAIISRLRDFAALKDEHIIKISDFGVFQGSPYCVMEYADGGDLREYSARSPLSESESVTLALDMIKALQCLEKSNVFHLDIKPENIMMRGQRFKLTDFGVIIDRSTSTVPVNAEFWTSAAYMAPEILSGDAPSGKSDIYSLGITLYQLVSGKNPFALDTPSASMYKQINVNPPPLCSEFKSISRLFSDTVSAMLCKNPHERPSLNDLAYAFSHVARKTESPSVKTASAQARKIFDFLCNASLSCNPCLMTGQLFEYIPSASFSFGNRVCCLLEKFSSSPSIIQSDYGRRVAAMSDKDYDEVNHLLVSQWRAGRAVSLAWYPSNPWTSSGCVDSSSGQGRELKDLLRPGSVPRLAFRKELTRVAAALHKLMKEEIPVLWKPFPMPNGGADFWWGSTSSRMVSHEDFEALWREVFEFLVNDKGLQNLIWTYAPSMHAAGTNSERVFYPGRECVDIIEIEYASTMMSPENYKQISSLGKPIGISGIPHPSAIPSDVDSLNAVALKKAFPKISFLIFSEKNISDGRADYNYQECPFFKHIRPHPQVVPEKSPPPPAVIKPVVPAKPAAVVPQPVPKLAVKTTGPAPQTAPKPELKASSEKGTVKERLEKLKGLFMEELITEEEYKQKKAELLKEL